jgi:hypothetical protein
MKKEAIYPSEMLAHAYQLIPCYVPKYPHCALRLSEHLKLLWSVHFRYYSGRESSRYLVAHLEWEISPLYLLSAPEVSFFT